MKLSDLLITDEILAIIAEEVTIIKNSTDRDASAIIKLEKLARTYSVIMANSREVVKSGILGKLSDAELEGGIADEDSDDT